MFRIKYIALPLLLSCLSAALLSCPSQSGSDTGKPETTKPSTTSSSADDTTASDKLQAAADATKAGAQKLGEDAKQLGGEIKEKAGEATEKAKEGFANFKDDVRQKYPQVVESMQKQFDAMNSWAVDKYQSNISPDAPEHDKLVASFKSDAEYKPKYTIEGFDVISQTDTEAVANVGLAYTGTDAAKPLATQHKKYKYTFHKKATDKQWQIYKIEPRA